MCFKSISCFSSLFYMTRHRILFLLLKKNFIFSISHLSYKYFFERMEYVAKDEDTHIINARRISKVVNKCVGIC